MKKIYKINGKGFFPKKSFKLLLYLFIWCKIWKSKHWIVCSYYIFHVFKISRKSKINSNVIIDMFKFYVFVVIYYS